MKISLSLLVQRGLFSSWAVSLFQTGQLESGNEELTGHSRARDALVEEDLDRALARDGGERGELELDVDQGGAVREVAREDLSVSGHVI
jgi:hypothetical protein